jgi:hypothetical protein
MKKWPVSFLPLLLSILIMTALHLPVASQVVEVNPVFPKLNDDVTVTFNASQGNGALMGVAPVYAHTGVITSESTNPSDWKHVQGNWGTPDPNVLMTSIGNNKHTLSYNIKDYYGIGDGETVESLAFVFRNASGSIVGRASDGADIFYPVYPDDVEFLSVLLSPQESSLALFEGEVLPVKGATSQDAQLIIMDNDDVLATAFGVSIQHNLTVTEAGNHTVRFIAIRGTDTLEQSFFYTTIVNVVTEDPPAGREDGLTLPSTTSAYFQLYAPNKSVVHLVGDMTNWDLLSEYQMKRSEDGNTWWIEVPGLTPDQLYRYQYVVDGSLRIGDPYSTLVLDPWNDGAITNETYPNMPVYPAALTTGNVSVFTMQPIVPTVEPLSPKIPKSDLIIYELLLRDYLHAHSFKSLRDTLDYLQRLGVNAIQLMPINEFEGNYGWGYNPSYHMALDKFYGPADELRALIEEAHDRGMVIILDVVYNHAFGQSPFAQLYWDVAQNRPSADNPWLNPVAKHDFNVGYDFNHESAATKYFVKRVTQYWMETFGIDGFRFDLSKGFTQNNTLGNIAAWGAYDQSRINIWQDYANHIWSIDSSAYIILEHFANNDEEAELSSRGMMLWGNSNQAYSQAAQGYGGSDLSNSWYVTRGWDEPHLVSYMESHDEERIMYRNITNGNSAPGYTIKDQFTALGRMGLVAPFFFLVPGPKMIWEFGELGYDYSINYCTNGTVNTNCRLDPKPIRWDYLEVRERLRVYDVNRAVIRLRQLDAWKQGSFTMSLASQFEKKIHVEHVDTDIIAVGNFHVGNRTITPSFTKPGTWYDYIDGGTLQIVNVDTAIVYEPGEYHVYTSSFVDPGFEVISDVRDIAISSVPLVIRPSLNDGHFIIDLPLTTQDFQINIFSIQGERIHAKSQLEGNAVSVFAENAAPGMYWVECIVEQTRYIGKMIIE